MSAPSVSAAFLTFGNSVFSHFLTSDGSRSSAWYNGLCDVMPSCASRRPTEFVASRRAPGQRLAFQSTPAATTILRQPIVNRRPVETECLADGFRALPLLNRRDCSSPHVFKHDA